MAKMVTGVRIESISIKRKTEDEGGAGVEFDGTYSIMGEEGKVFAKQSFNSYNAAVKMEVSAEVAAAIRLLCDQTKKEIETITGIA